MSFYSPRHGCCSSIWKQRCNVVIPSLLLHLMGPEVSGWRFTRGALKPGRVPLFCLCIQKCWPCVHPEMLFPAHHPFRCWHHEPGAQAKDSSGAKDTAAVPGHGTAARLAGQCRAHLPFRDAFAVLGCCPARGGHSSFVQGEESPCHSPAPEQGGTGDGWGRELNLSHFLCKSTRVQAQAAPWGRGRQPCSTALSHAPQAENTLNAFLLLICSFVSSSHQCRQPTSDGAFQMISLATFANMSLSLLER